jgi:hypothetical protein
VKSRKSPRNLNDVEKKYSEFYSEIDGNLSILEDSGSDFEMTLEKEMKNLNSDLSSDEDSATMEIKPKKEAKTKIKNPLFKNRALAEKNLAVIRETCPLKD